MHRILTFLLLLQASACAADLKGVPNFHKVSEKLYRSGQPTAEGFQNLEAHGIEAIVSLRSFHSDRRRLKGTSLQYERLTVKAWHPEWKEAVAFLKMATSSEGPILVHCQHGSDRTGTMCALYRIVVEGWPKEQAIAEMTRGGYGYHSIWQNLPAWIRSLDIDALTKEIELP